MRFGSRVAAVVALLGAAVAILGAIWVSGTTTRGAASALQLAVIVGGLAIVATSGLGWAFWRVVLAEREYSEA